MEQGPQIKSLQYNQHHEFYPTEVLLRLLQQKLNDFLCTWQHIGIEQNPIEIYKKQRKKQWKSEAVTYFNHSLKFLF